MKYQTIELTYPQTGIALITMNHPETLNALSELTLEELLDAVRILEREKVVRVVILTGKGKAFVAGADIVDMSTMQTNAARDYSAITQQIYDEMRRSAKIYIAAVNGYAFGGGSEVALACDLCLASERAKFGLPEVSLGILPGGGGTQRLALRVGIQKAKELILTASTIDAATAEQIGLVLKAVPEDKLMEETYLLADKIMKNAPVAVKYAKACVENLYEPILSQGLRYEAALFGACFDTQDQKEGMEAFIAKRKPVYSKEV